MNRQLSLLFLFVVLNSSFAQAQSWIMAKEATPISGGQNDLYPDHSIATDDSGNIYLTGAVYGSVAFGSSILTGGGVGAEELLLVKYDSNGNVIWARQTSGSSGYTYGTSVAVDKKGNVFVTGSFTGNQSFGTVTLSSPNYCMFIAKYDPNGNVIWAEQPASSFQSFGNAVAVDKSGNVYATGSFSGNLTVGTFTLTNGINYTTFLIKYNTGGNALWAECAISSVNSQGNSVVADTSGNVYITGRFFGNVSFGSYTLSTSNGSGDLFITKYDKNGNAMWADASTIPVPLGINGISVAVDALGNVYGLSGSIGLYLARYNPANGNVVWVDQCSNADDATWRGFSVVCDTLGRGGGYALLSAYGNNGYGSTSFNMVFGNQTIKLNAAYSTATAIIQFDTAGNTLCSNIFTEGDEDDGSGMAVSESGKFIVIGGDLFNSTILGKDTLSYGNDVAFIARWQNCLASGDSTVQHPEGADCIYVPDAFSPNNDGQNDVLYVRGACIKDMDFIVYDRWGNKMFESKSQGEGWDGTYNGQPMNTGTYVWYLKAALNDGSVVNKKGSVTLVR